MVAPIVVGFDGSPGAAHALAWACGTATAKRIPLRVVTAVQARRLPATSIVRPPTEEDLETALQAAQGEVDRLLARLQETPVDCTVVAVAGQPAAVLLDEAGGAGQLVVGSRGLGGLSRLLIGSVSSQVVHHARCPVTVVPALASGNQIAELTPTGTLD